MSAQQDCVFTLESSAFYSLGRALVRGFERYQLGLVELSVAAGALTITTEAGGGRVAVEGEGSALAHLTPRAFASLVGSRREKAPSGTMHLAFRPSLREVAVDRVGVKAKFPG